MRHAMREKTLVLIKPDGVRRRLMGEVIGRFEARGFDIVAMKMIRFDEELTQKHYGQYAGEDFYPALCEFIQSGLSVAMVVEADNAIALVRKMMGALNVMEAEPGTIRGDFAHHQTRNVIHGSDSPETAAREVACFFSENEVFGRVDEAS